PKIHPGASEATDGKDNDCDRIADDGKSTSDGDGDGLSIAAGDCDDTRKDVYLGAPELLDGRDNDCDKQTDEDFTHRILLNDGSGHFTVAPAQGGVSALEPTTVAAFGDGNGDGKLDLYYGNWLVTYPYDPAVPDRYFEGKGDGTFVDAQAKAGLVLATPYSPYGVSWADYNNDGLPDLYVSNYHMYPNQLWKNLGGGVFVDVAVKVGVAYDEIPGPNTKLPGGHSYNAAFGDVDNDGDLDLFLCNLAHPRVQPWSDPSTFLVSRGAPEWSFENRTQASGFAYDEGDVGAAFGDYDNDGDLDLAIASLYTGHYSKLYRNDGAKGFVDVTYEAGVAVHDAVTVTWADVDEDGALDLLLADRDGVAPNVHLFLNRVGKKGGTYVALDLRGSTTNRDAAGARVTLRTGSTTQIREVPGGGGNPQLPHTLHVGLGGAGTIDELTVRWVGGGFEKVSGAQPGGRFRIVEGSGKAVKP
ncbi:MAG: FG-GAP-like repeat-containing protein, partial [Acidobacteriota bacterium]